MSRLPLLLGCGLILLAAGSAGGNAQEPILVFSLDSETIEIPSGGEGSVRIDVENVSIREADDIEFIWVEPDGFRFEPSPEPIERLSPFRTTRLDLAIAAEEAAVEGEYDGLLEIVYTYCIDELCFQIVDRQDVRLRVIAPQATPVVANGSDNGSTVADLARQRAGIPWEWIGSALVGVLFVVSCILWAARRVRSSMVATLIVIVGGALAVGVLRGQHEQARSIGGVLCTSCVGIEESREPEPYLSADAVTWIERIEEPIELVVFYAPWCHACPFAEALVELVAFYNERISYRFVNVEEDASLAERYGVIRSGRTVVPAILRVDTGSVLFGIEDLEQRLLHVLGGAA